MGTGLEEPEERKLVGNEPDEISGGPLAETVPVPLGMGSVAFVRGYGADGSEPLGREPEEAEAAVVGTRLDEPYGLVEFGGPEEIVKGSGLSVTEPVG